MDREFKSDPLVDTSRPRRDPPAVRAVAQSVVSLSASALVLDSDTDDIIHQAGTRGS